jgi:DNA-directed RNA polymerase beta subunit
LANGGYNIEDGLIFNRASIERGLFRSTITRSTRDVVHTVENEREELMLPPEGCRSRLHADYSQINPETGVVDPGAHVGPNTVYISKMVHMTSKQKVVGPDGVEHDEEVDKVRDRSTTAKTKEPSIVDEVIFSKTLEGDTSVRVKTRAVRIPEVGDKFCSRYGQKGTIGAIYEAVDMPFCPETGISPDIIINPHALPSRMTIGHLIEKLMGKLAALSGELADGTPFSASEDYQHDDDHDVVINKISEQLSAFGFSGEGTEVLCDGRTGKKMQMKVFIGPMSYQKLRHMVQDKYHARSRGPVQMQTGQPVEGRHRDGGQRFGEMERDNLLGHGASNLLLERLLVSSDQSTVPVCTECGHIAQPPKRNAGNALFSASLHADKPFCQNCVRHDTVRMCEMPFAYKLSTQEIQALHLKAGFKFEKE